ncbi:hypothetical protein B0H21DRAFT_144630 [Amylocystis lapponica]|nr:hypothetical protein B0H21DRAFT_144630 [Amylocystis lapponica]
MAQAPSHPRVCGLWGSLIARRPCPQGNLMACVSSGSCTVSIFACPASALGLGGPSFLPAKGSNPNLIYTIAYSPSTKSSNIKYYSSTVQ